MHSQTAVCFLKDCKMKHAASTKGQPGISHVDIKSSSLVESWQSLAESVHHGGWVLRGLTCVWTACWQVKQSSTQANAMALPQALCKQNWEGRQQHVFISQGKLWRQRKTGQEQVWAASCHAPSLFFSTQPTAGPRGLMVEAAPATCGCHVCCPGTFSVHMQQRPCPPPLLPRLGLYLGLWHLQPQPKRRLPDQLASPLQWSDPCGVGKRLHKGSSRELPLGTDITLEKWSFRNLNITFPLAFFWHLELFSHRLLFPWYRIVQSFRKLLCFALLSVGVFKILLLSVPLCVLSTSPSFSKMSNSFGEHLHTEKC